MDRKRHNLVTKAVLDREYNEVHQWLDENYSKYRSNPYYHHIERHNIEAIMEKYKDQPFEANAAMLHVFCDFIWHHNLPYVPKDPQDIELMYLKMGKIKQIRKEGEA